MIATKPLVALAVIGLGIVQIADVRMPSLTVPLRLAAGRALPASAAVFVYGFGYALASTGCTLPLYVSITVLPLTSGFSGAALVTFLSFAVAMALLMVLTTLLVPRWAGQAEPGEGAAALGRLGQARQRGRVDPGRGLPPLLLRSRRDVNTSSTPRRLRMKRPSVIAIVVGLLIVLLAPLPAAAGEQITTLQVKGMVCSA